MKKITLLFLLAFSTLIALNAQEVCTSNSTFTFYTTNAGWSESEYYKIIDIDAANLTDSSLPLHSGDNGTNTSSNFGSGSFSTTIYTYNENTGLFEPTNIMWPVNYHMACFAPNFYNSAYTKVNELGTLPSKGSPVECTNNDNSVLQSPIWDKKGFIELSRQAASTAEPTVSQHGYLEIDDLPMVERVQWSFSSTGYKRGVKLDIKYNDGEWQPLQWEASEVNYYSTFAEQGYQFENMINKQDDATSKISLRWRIWDGDSIHTNPVTSATFTTTNAPLAMKQVVRIHQIKIFTGVVPDSAPNAVFIPNANTIQYVISDNNIKLSENCKVELYSVDGKRLINKYSDMIDVSGLDRGIYILKAINTQGQILNKKIKL